MNEAKNLRMLVHRLSRPLLLLMPILRILELGSRLFLLLTAKESNLPALLTSLKALFAKVHITSMSALRNREFMFSLFYPSFTGLDFSFLLLVLYFNFVACYGDYHNVFSIAFICMCDSSTWYLRH